MSTTTPPGVSLRDSNNNDQQCRGMLAGTDGHDGVNLDQLIAGLATKQDPIIAGNGIRIPDGRTINSTLVEGLDDAQVVIGGATASGQLYLVSTADATKGGIFFGSPVGPVGFIDESTGLWSVGLAGIGPVTGRLNVAGLSSSKISAGFHDGSSGGAVGISHPSSTVARIMAHTSVALKLGSNNVADRIVLDTAGHVTFSDLAGTGTVLTRVTSAGLFERAVPGADYQLAIAAGTGIRIPDGFTIFAKLSEGVAGGQSVIGGQSASDNLTLSSTTNATKGLFVFGGTAVATLNEATKNLAVGAVYDATLGGRIQATGATAGTSAAFTDGTASAVKVTHPSSSVAAIAAPSAVALNLGAGGTTTYLQIATGGGVTLTSLAGTGTSLVRATAAGLLERAVAGTDFVAPFSLTNRSVVVSAGGSALTEDNSNFAYDTTNHRLVLSLAATYSPAAGAPLTISGSASSVAVLLNEAAAQIINKTGGSLTIGTTDANLLALKTNGTTRASWDGTTGLLTLSGDVLMSASGTSGFSKSNGALVFGTDGPDSLLIKTGASTRLTIDSTGVITAANLAGTGSTLVKVSSTGVLSRGVAGTDYLAAPSFTAGSVIFSGGGSVLLEDNTNLFFNDSTNTLKTPNVQLDTLTMDIANLDVVLLRDAANIAALRRTTNAQGLRVYNTFTSSTNFERGNLTWASNEWNVGTEKGSGGGTDCWVRATGAGWNFFANAGTFSAPTKIGINLATTYANVDGNTLDVLSIPSTTIAVTGSTATNTLARGLSLIDIGGPIFNAGGTTQTITTASTLCIEGSPTQTSGATITNKFALNVRSGVSRIDSILKVSSRIDAETALAIGNLSTTGAFMQASTGLLTIFDGSVSATFLTLDYTASPFKIIASQKLKFSTDFATTAAGDVGMLVSTGRLRIFSPGFSGVSTGDQQVGLLPDFTMVWAVKLFLGSSGDPVLPTSVLGELFSSNDLKFKQPQTISTISITVRTISSTLNGTLNMFVKTGGTTRATTADIAASTVDAKGTTASVSVGATDDISFGLGGTSTSGNAEITFFVRFLA